MMRILTNNDGSAASASAALLPVMPTPIPQTRLHTPTVIPDQKSEYPKLSETYTQPTKLTCIKILLSVDISPFYRDQFRRKHNGHNDSVYSYNFAKDDRYKVLGLNSWRFNTSADDRNTCYPNSTRCSNDA